MLLQAAIGAFNRMGENVEEQRKGAFASKCNQGRVFMTDNIKTSNGV